MILSKEINRYFPKNLNKKVNIWYTKNKERNIGYAPFKFVLMVYLQF